MLSNEKRVILCVDDEKIILDSLESELSSKLSSNYIIEIAESGEEAFEIIEDIIEDELDLALVISDYIMPNMKGDELLIKLHKILPDTIKIMLTGQADANAIGNVINQAKLYQYISKPWEKDDLWLTVSSALENYEQHKSILAILNEKKDAQKKIIATRKQMFEVHNSKLQEQKISVENLQSELEHITNDKNILIEKYKKLDTINQKLKSQNAILQNKFKEFQKDISFHEHLKKEIQKSLDKDRTFTIICLGIDTFDILVNKWQDKNMENRILLLLEQYIKEIMPIYYNIEKLSGGIFKIIATELDKDVNEYVNNLSKELNVKIGRFGDDLITISFFAYIFSPVPYKDTLFELTAIAEKIDKDVENQFTNLRLDSSRNIIKIG